MNSLRFIDFDTHTSSIRLELPFWETIDGLAGGRCNWQLWAKEQLKSKPKNCGMTSWLRQMSHNALVHKLYA
jgi:predicted DNA-binding ribbon-helix-helix protein